MRDFPLPRLITGGYVFLVGEFKPFSKCEKELFCMMIRNLLYNFGGLKPQKSFDYKETYGFGFKLGSRKQDGHHPRFLGTDIFSKVR
jgi:hypothetical protein